MDSLKLPEDNLDIPKYRKTTESSVSKSHKKSKHKHQYTSVLFHYNIEVYGKSIEKYNRGQYCTICGRIGDFHPFESKKITMENGKSYYQNLTSQEILNKYSNLTIIDIDPFLNKYIPISK